MSHALLPSLKSPRNLLLGQRPFLAPAGSAKAPNDPEGPFTHASAAKSQRHEVSSAIFSMEEISMQSRVWLHTSACCKHYWAYSSKHGHSCIPRQSDRPARLPRTAWQHLLWALSAAPAARPPLAELQWQRQRSLRVFQPRHHPADTMQTWRNFLQSISIALSCFFSTSPSKVS